jgi:pyruvate ferredoxin oxidoreductase alpha subunit
VETHIVERLADYISDGTCDAEMIHVESEHSALSATLGAQATGVRTFTATSSQGLAYMFEVLYIVSGMRMPVVMAVANRTLSAPINIWNDHQDSIGARDSGWIQLYVESAQEALDTVIMAYMIAENRKILLPIMVCLDGFTLTHVYEPVDIPSQKEVDSFLPPYKPLYLLDTKKPVTMGPIGFPDSFMHFKKQQEDAIQGSLSIIKKVNQEFKKAFGRSYGNGLVEGYRLAGAKYALLAMGSVCGTARVVVDEMREQGKKVGLIKLKSFRPFPEQDIIELTKKLKGIAVIDKDISLGNNGALFIELRNALYGKKIKITSIIAGLGGRDITKKHLEKAMLDIEKAKKPEWML